MISNIKTSVILNETVQLANKYYFRNNKLSTKEIEMILNITKKDNTTKLVCDIYYNDILQQLNDVNGSINDVASWNKIIKTVRFLHQLISDYTNKVFPIKNFNINDGSDLKFITFVARNNIIAFFKQLPSVAYRNCKDKSNPMDTEEFKQYSKNLQIFIKDFNDLNYTTDKTSKLFKSERGLDNWIQYMENTKQSKITDYVDIISKDTIDDIIYLSRNIKVIARNENYMFVKIDNSDDIRLLGCHSKWCFADNGVLKNDTRYWENFSYRDAIFVLIHFRYTQTDPRFMTVFIQPFLNNNDEIMRYEGERNFNSPAFNNYNINLSTIALGVLWNDFTKTLTPNQYQEVKEEVLNW